MNPIIITGFMGCGKTEVARKLALRLNLPMIDLDLEIAGREGRTAAQLIIEEGEAAFRVIETTTLRELLEGGIVRVIALGGGAWITEANRSLIRESQGITVWLDAPFELCWQRIEASPEVRPLGRSREQAAQLYSARQPVYQLASIRVPVLAGEPLENLVDRLEMEVKTQETQETQEAQEAQKAQEHESG
jgi:shikimate kinase